MADDTNLANRDEAGATPDTQIKSLADIARLSPSLAETMEHVYAWRRCAGLAYVLSCETMLPVMILDCDVDFGHAAIVVDNSSARQEDWLVADIMGIRTVAEVRSIYESKMGPLQLSFYDDPEDGGCALLMDSEPQDALRCLAGRCPWLRDRVPEPYRQMDNLAAVEELDRLMRAIRSDLRSADRKWTSTWTVVDALLDGRLDEDDIPVPVPISWLTSLEASRTADIFDQHFTTSMIEMHKKAQSVELADEEAVPDDEAESPAPKP